MILEWLESLDSGKVAGIALDILGGALVACGSLLFLFYAVKFGMFGAWHVRQYRWRKNPKVGDRAFFYNAGGGITIGEVKSVSDDRLKVVLYSSHGNGFSTCQYDTKHLHQISKDEEDYINDQKLQATLKRLKGLR